MIIGLNTVQFSEDVGRRNTGNGPSVSSSSSSITTLLALQSIATLAENVDYTVTLPHVIQQMDSPTLMSVAVGL